MGGRIVGGYRVKLYQASELIFGWFNLEFVCVYLFVGGVGWFGLERPGNEINMV